MFRCTAILLSLLVAGSATGCASYVTPANAQSDASADTMFLAPPGYCGLAHGPTDSPDAEAHEWVCGDGSYCGRPRSGGWTCCPNATLCLRD